MKKIHVLLFAMLALAATSCKKDKADDSIHLKCKIDGAEKTFNVGANASVITQGDNMYFGVVGVEKAASTSEHLSFVITKPGVFTAGTYTVDNEDYYISGQYNMGAAGTSFFSGSLVESSETSQALKVTISHIDDKTVRGTFSGAFYEDADDSNTKKTITDGSFYLKINEELPD